MKTAIKLALVSLLILQVVTPILALIPCAIYLYATTGSLDQTALAQMMVILGQLIGTLLMAFYLWKAGYISTAKSTWRPTSFSYLLLCVVLLLSSGWLVSVLMSHMSWIPNIMKQTFDILQTGWVGILVIAVLGPLVEELLFRGAITKVLLNRYEPAKAILIAALLFAIFHLNPAQMLPAFFYGIIFGWIYYKTASLVPCIFMHILNNSIAVYFSIKYPDVENIDELISGVPYWAVTAGAVLLLFISYFLMRRTTVACDWKESKENLAENYKA